MQAEIAQIGSLNARAVSHRAQAKTDRAPQGAIKMYPRR